MKNNKTDMLTIFSGVTDILKAQPRIFEDPA